MIVWLDNHLSPTLARWIELTLDVSSLQIRDIGLARASDAVIFDAARLAQAVLITKDRDFAELIDRRGAPPAIILLTCGNTSTEYLRELLQGRLAQAFALIDGGDVLVEIGGGA